MSASYSCTLRDPQCRTQSGTESEHPKQQIGHETSCGVKPFSAGATVNNPWVGPHSDYFLNDGSSPARAYFCGNFFGREEGGTTMAFGPGKNSVW